MYFAINPKALTDPEELLWTFQMAAAYCRPVDAPKVPPRWRARWISGETTLDVSCVQNGRVWVAVDGFAIPFLLET